MKWYETIYQNVDTYIKYDIDVVQYHFESRVYTLWSFDVSKNMSISVNQFQEDMI